MNKTLCAVVALVAAVGFTAPVAADPMESDQTSSEQVKMCDSGLSSCQGGDNNACVVALKTCVGEKRGQAMKAMEKS